jgi:hypothetical protein
VSVVAMLATQVATTPVADPIADLQQRLDQGKTKLDYEPDQGYLRAVLKQLDISETSQALVFSKSSFQLHLISPSTPRALYFNDDVYVGFVQDGPMLEFASVNPRSGPVFYTLSQDKDTPPKFERLTSECLACHVENPATGPVPRLLMLSVLPNPNGNAINAASLLTNDQSPWKERWGGWYVTGKHGSMRHMGNTTVRPPESSIGSLKDYMARVDQSAGANVTDLSTRFDTKPYLTPNSDIVALMVLAHQTHLHNWITLAADEVSHAGMTPDTIREATDPLIRAMLFANASPFTEAVTGTTGFAEYFSSQGPRDSHGRSLRQLDLKTRLFRYPVSYLIYSKQFDELPQPVRQYIYRRIREVLTGQDKSPIYATIAESDRAAILEILEETKPEFKAD